MNFNEFEVLSTLGISRKDNPYWYKDFRDEYLHEVTNHRSNSNLFLGEIKLETPSAEQAKQGIVFIAYIISNVGTFPVLVCQSTKSSDCLELKSHPLVLVNTLTAAQVLRYAETQCILA
jgi:hypothetical protein